MGNKLARTSQVSAWEYYLHDLPSSYDLVLKDALGGSRGRYLYPVAGTLSRRNKLSDVFRGDKDSHCLKSLAIVSAKSKSVGATKKDRNEGQEEAIREAMAAFMEMDSLKAPKVPNDIRAKKVKFGDLVQNREDILENKMNAGADIQEEKYVRSECVSMETSGRNGANKVGVQIASEVFSRRPKLERDRGEISAKNIIKRAENLIADSSLNFTWLRRNSGMHPLQRIYVRRNG